MVSQTEPPPQLLALGQNTWPGAWFCFLECQERGLNTPVVAPIATELKLPTSWFPEKVTAVVLPRQAEGAWQRVTRVSFRKHLCLLVLTSLVSSGVMLPFATGPLP